MELPEMAKQIVLIKENNLYNLVATWAFCLKLKKTKTKTLILGFDD